MGRRCYRPRRYENGDRSELSSIVERSDTRKQIRRFQDVIEPSLAAWSLYRKFTLESLYIYFLQTIHWSAFQRMKYIFCQITKHSYAFSLLSYRAALYFEFFLHACYRSSDGKEEKKLSTIASKWRLMKLLKLLVASRVKLLHCRTTRSSDLSARKGQFRYPWVSGEKKIQWEWAFERIENMAVAEGRDRRKCYSLRYSRIANRFFVVFFSFSFSSQHRVLDVPLIC